MSPFRLFFTGRLISLLGSAMTPVALAFAVLDASHRPTDLGVVLACQIVPQLTFLLVGGVAADRFRRRVVLLGSHLGAGLTQAAVAAVASIDDLISYAAIPLGQILTGPLAELLGARRVALTAGVVYAVSKLAPLTLRSVRDLRAVTTTAAASS